MADELFNVIFRGEVLAGRNPAEVKARFAQLFKMDAAKAEGFFSGKPVVLKPNCDRATADKFKAVLEQAGAGVEIRAVAPAAQAAPSPATPQAAPPVAPRPQPAPAAPPAQQSAVQSATPPASAASVSSVAASAPPADSWSLSAAGSNLLRPNEINTPAAKDIDISHLAVVKPKLFSTEPEEPLEPARAVQAPSMNLSAYSVANVGEPLVPFEEFVPRELDLSEFVLDAVGADVLRPEERKEFVPANVDTSSMNIAPAGGDLGQIKPPEPPPPPSTEHLSVQK
jgi:hypothetical protein